MKALKTDYANFREVLRTMPPEPYHTPANWPWSAWGWRSGYDTKDLIGFGGAGMSANRRVEAWTR